MDADKKIMNRCSQRPKRTHLRSHLTPAEASLWLLLKGKAVADLKFRRQHGVGPYILDFYCPALRLCIELDGQVHLYTEDYDEARTRYLSQVAHITVLRYENRAVFEYPETILREIEEVKQQREKEEVKQQREEEEMKQQREREESKEPLRLTGTSPLQWRSGGKEPLRPAGTSPLQGKSGGKEPLRPAGTSPLQGRSGGKER